MSEEENKKQAAPGAADLQAAIEVVKNEPSAAFNDGKAIVIGATGETGRHVVRLFAACDSVKEVAAVVRRELSEEEIVSRWNLEKGTLEREKLRQIVVDYEKLEESEAAFAGYNIGVSCLGSTRAKAGSAEAFRKIDFDLVVDISKRLKQAGVKHYSVLSAQNADHKAWLTYSQVKGACDEECKTMGFERLSIIRPGLLLTQRLESRTMEALAQKIYPSSILPVSMRATKTVDVAKAIVVNALRKARESVEVYYTKDIHKMDLGASSNL